MCLVKWLIDIAVVRRRRISVSRGDAIDDASPILHRKNCRRLEQPSVEMWKFEAGVLVCERRARRTADHFAMRGIVSSRTASTTSVGLQTWM